MPIEQPPITPDTSLQAWATGIGNGSVTSPIGGLKVVNSTIVLPSCSNKTFDMRNVRLEPWTYNEPSGYILRGQGGTAYPSGTLTAGGLAAVANITATGIEGATTLTLTGAGTVVPGFYLLNLDIAVTHNVSGAVQYGERALIKITDVNAGVATLDALSILGKDYTNATLHNVTSKVIDGSTIYMPAVKGYYGAEMIDSMRYSNPVFMVYLYDCEVYFPRQNGASQTGVKFVFITGCNIYYSSSINLGGSAQRYSTEFYSCHNSTMWNSTSFNERTNALLQGGCTNITYRDAVHTQDVDNMDTSGRVDLGHGHGEANCSVINVTCNGIICANPSWRRGATNMLIDGCNTNLLQVDCGANLEVVDSQATYIQMNTEVEDQDSLGTFGVTSLLISNCTVTGLSGYHAVITTGDTSYLPQTLTISDTEFTASSAKLVFNCRCDNATAADVTFENCTFNSSGSTDYISIFGTGKLNISFTNCNFNGSTGYPATFNGTVNGTFAATSCRKNDSLVNIGNFYFAGTTNFSKQILDEPL